jgi:hypothetical protein
MYMAPTIEEIKREVAWQLAGISPDVCNNSSSKCKSSSSSSKLATIRGTIAGHN